MGKRGLKNVAYDYLLDAIMSYELKPGQAIVEQDISDRLNISLHSDPGGLQAAGIRRAGPPSALRGTFVTNLTVQDVEEIFQLRELFEITALKSAINCITDDELDYIEDRVRYLDDKKSEEPPTQEAFYRSDRDLHMMIMKYSGNSA